MSSLLDLTKKVQLVLDKKGITKTVAEVKMGMDYSPSMYGLYKNGTVQKTVDRLSAVAVKFDDNSTLDSFVFAGYSQEIEPVVPSMFGSYVNDYIVNNRNISIGSGTDYAPVLRDMVNHYGAIDVEVEYDVEEEIKEDVGFFKGLFGVKPKVTTQTVTKTTVKKMQVDKDIPAYCIIVTDGENSDESATRQLLASTQGSKIFFQFVGIGNENFSFLKKIRNDYENVSFFDIPDLNKITDEDLYNDLISDKFAKWLNKK